MDYDLISVILNRRHPAVIYLGQPRFLPSEENHFIFYCNRPAGLIGWGNQVRSVFSDEEEVGDEDDWMVTSHFENKTPLQIGNYIYFKNKFRSSLGLFQKIY